MTIATVIAYGPNEVEIPLLAFASADDAHAYMQKLGFVVNEEYPDTYSEVLVDGKKVQAYNFLEDLDYDDKTFLPLLFKDGNYYGGCGEAGAFSVKEIEFGQPIVGWNLD